MIRLMVYFVDLANLSFVVSNNEINLGKNKEFSFHRHQVLAI